VKPFHIYNTLARSVEEFRPQDPSAVTIYSCGPTVYLPQHLGNFRTFLSWDFLRRALEFTGYGVRHVMNITDVGHMTSEGDVGEDKIEKTARAEHKSPLEVANFYTDLFLRDWDLLHLKRPVVICRATEHIPEMLALIERIIAAGYAYVTPSGVYFDVEKWRGPSRIGRLSRQSLDEQDSAQRLEHSPDKKSPHDFALWFLNKPSHILQWEGPWGRGYPGWHIECSAMAMKYLGETIDIHTGGMDHIPIHHENEIGQSESATGKPFARYFMHSAFLVNKEGVKISKSAGKFPLLSELPRGVEPLAFRMLCFGAKYRSELVYSDEGLRAAQSNLEYLREFARNVPRDAEGARAGEWTGEFGESFEDALCDDLNTPRALAATLELVAQAYRRQDWSAWNLLGRFDQVLGLKLAEHREASLAAAFPAEANALIARREKARKERDFALADRLRKELLDSFQIVAKDLPDGKSAYYGKMTGRDETGKG